MAEHVRERKSAGPRGRIQCGRRRMGKIIAGFLVWGIDYMATPLRLAIRGRCKRGMDMGQEVEKMTDLIWSLQMLKLMNTHNWVPGRPVRYETAGLR